MAMNPRVKSGAIFAAKVIVAATLIGWLIRSGVLKMGALSIFLERPILLVADLSLFAFAVMMGTLRWRALLVLAGAKIPLGRAIQLQLTALFFNVVIPGNVGGDVVKALYVAREQEPSKRTADPADRIRRAPGRARRPRARGDRRRASCAGRSSGGRPQLRQLAMAVGFLGVCTVVGPALFVLGMRRAGDRLEAWTSGTTVIAKLAGRLVAAARLLSAGPKQLVLALGLSMLAHAGTMTFFTVLTRVITEQDVPFSSVATVFPLGHPDDDPAHLARGPRRRPRRVRPALLDDWPPRRRDRVQRLLDRAARALPARRLPVPGAASAAASSRARPRATRSAPRSPEGRGHAVRAAARGRS